MEAQHPERSPTAEPSLWVKPSYNPIVRRNLQLEWDNAQCRNESHNKNGDEPTRAITPPRTLTRVALRVVASCKPTAQVGRPTSKNSKVNPTTITAPISLAVLLSPNSC